MATEKDLDAGSWKSRNSRARLPVSGHATARHARDTIHLQTFTHIPDLPPATGAVATSTRALDSTLHTLGASCPAAPAARRKSRYTPHTQAYLQRDFYRGLPRPHRVPLPVLSPTAPVARRESRYTLAHPYSEHASPFFPVSAQAHLQRHSCLHAPTGAHPAPPSPPCIAHLDSAHTHIPLPTLTHRHYTTPTQPHESRCLSHPALSSASRRFATSPRSTNAPSSIDTSRARAFPALNPLLHRVHPHLHTSPVVP
ncbi:hypothetical protein C8R44DRAFT_992344 [Mycena epipterygia]|nr:hypothetical protein C8R44DRAFT_992344 [Mycena epipterygia]